MVSFAFETQNHCASLPLSRPLALELDGDIDDAAIVPQLRRNLDLADFSDLFSDCDLCAHDSTRCHDAVLLRMAGFLSDPSLGAVLLSTA